MKTVFFVDVRSSGWTLHSLPGLGELIPGSPSWLIPLVLLFLQPGALLNERLQEVKGGEEGG